MALFYSSLVCFLVVMAAANSAKGASYMDNELPSKYYVTHEAWFNISIRDSKTSNKPIKTGRIVLGLFGDICPMTVTNFITITKGLRRGTVRIEKIIFSENITNV